MLYLDKNIYNNTIIVYIERVKLEKVKHLCAAKKCPTLNLFPDNSEMCDMVLNVLLSFLFIFAVAASDDDDDDDDLNNLTYIQVRNL